MKTQIEWDFQTYFEYFIDQLTGEGKEFKETFYRKVFQNAREEAKRNLEYIIDNFSRDLESKMDSYKTEIAEKMVNEFCQFYWEKWENGHDYSEGMKAICYFKETNKYFIGTCVKSEVEGYIFLLENGQILDPDYVAPLYEFKEK